ncbi:hypothetical protein [Candidatus Cyrtobacter comes]|nr:hypothetical protein [Candidatus Cyrtobacter comes]
MRSADIDNSLHTLIKTLEEDQDLSNLVPMMQQSDILSINSKFWAAFRNGIEKGGGMEGGRAYEIAVFFIKFINTETEKSNLPNPKYTKEEIDLFAITMLYNTVIAGKKEKRTTIDIIMYIIKSIGESTLSQFINTSFHNTHRVAIDHMPPEEFGQENEKPEQLLDYTEKILHAAIYDEVVFNTILSIPGIDIFAQDSRGLDILEIFRIEVQNTQLFKIEKQANNFLSILKKLGADYKSHDGGNLLHLLYGINSFYRTLPHIIDSLAEFYGKEAITTMLMNQDNEGRIPLDHYQLEFDQKASYTDLTSLIHTQLNLYLDYIGIETFFTPNEQGETMFETFMRNSLKKLEDKNLQYVQASMLLEGIYIFTHQKIEFIKWKNQNLTQAEDELLSKYLYSLCELRNDSDSIMQKAQWLIGAKNSEGFHFIDVESTTNPNTLLHFFQETSTLHQDMRECLIKAGAKHKKPDDYSALSNDESFKKRLADLQNDLQNAHNTLVTENVAQIITKMRDNAPQSDDFIEKNKAEFIANLKKVCASEIQNYSNILSGLKSIDGQPPKGLQIFEENKNLKDRYKSYENYARNMEQNLPNQIALYENALNRFESFFHGQAREFTNSATNASSDEIFALLNNTATILTRDRENAEEIIYDFYKACIDNGVFKLQKCTTGFINEVRHC